MTYPYPDATMTKKFQVFISLAVLVMGINVVRDDYTAKI